MVTTIFHQIFRRKTRAVSMALLAFVIAITGTCFTGGGTAHADVVPHEIKHIYMNLSNHPDSSLQRQYIGLIQSLRAAAGHRYRNGVLETELNDHQQSSGLIRLTLTYNNTVLTLWLTPYNLYLRGFTNQAGHTFQFNDSDYNLYDRLNGLPGHPTGGYTTLPFGSSYTSLSHRDNADRSRQNMPISFGDIYNSFFNLAYTTNLSGGHRQEVARSLMMMVQLTSEAARLNDVLNLMTRVMGDRYLTYAGLPSLMDSLENKWDSISTFGHDITENPSTRPRYISPQIGTLYSWNDVLRYLGVLLYRAYPVGGSPGQGGH